LHSFDERYYFPDLASALRGRMCGITSKAFDIRVENGQFCVGFGGVLQESRPFGQSTHKKPPGKCAGRLDALALVYATFCLVTPVFGRLVRGENLACYLHRRSV